MIAISKGANFGSKGLMQNINSLANSAFLKKYGWLVAVLLLLVITWFVYNETLFAWVFFLSIVTGFILHTRKTMFTLNNREPSGEQAKKSVTRIWAGIFVFGSIFYVAALHPHFGTHAQAIANDEAAQAQTARAQQQAQARRAAYQQHLQRVAWQRAHPAEYAARLATARADALRVEQQHIAAERVQLAQVAQAQKARERAQAQANAVAAANQAESDNEMPGDPDCLVFLRNSDHAVSTDDGWSIEGKVVNKCDRSFGYAEVDFTFYDSSGNLESSGLININNLEAGQTWAFDKQVYEQTSDGGTYRVTGVKGF